VISEQAAIFLWLDHLSGTFALLGILIGVIYGAWKTARTARETRELRTDMNHAANVAAERAQEAARARDRLYDMMMRVALGVDGVVEKLSAAKEREGFARGQQAGLSDEVAAGIKDAVSDPDNPLAMAGSKPTVRR
jgi:hypothetical protein